MISAVYSAISEMLMSGLFWDEMIHGLVALPFAIFLWKKTKQIKFIIIFYLVVYMIDMDHWVDYIEYHGFHLSLVDFVKLDYFKHKVTAYVPFHAWEWVILLGWFASRNKKPWSTYAAAIGLAMFAHMTWDVVGQKNVLFYSIVYRALHNFIFIPS